MKILLTGFDPFGGEPINPAQEAVERVNNNINGARNHKDNYTNSYDKIC